MHISRRIRFAAAAAVFGTAVVLSGTIPAQARPGPREVSTYGVIHPLSVEGPLGGWCLTVSSLTKVNRPLYLEPCIKVNGKRDPNQLFHTTMFRGFGYIAVPASSGLLCIGEKTGTVTVLAVDCGTGNAPPGINYHIHFSAVGGMENQIVESGPHQMTVTAHPRLSVKVYQLGWRPGGEPKDKFIQVYRFTRFHD